MDVKDFIKKLEESKKQFTAEGKKIIKLALADAFEKNPSLEVISWTQYTPYFNDGEECIFSVNDVNFSNGSPDDVSHGEVSEDTEGVWSYSSWSLERKCPEGIDDLKSLKLVAELLCHDEMSDIMRDVFEDHSQIVATRDGEIDVQEYEHE